MKIVFASPFLPTRTSPTRKTSFRTVSMCISAGIMRKTTYSSTSSMIPSRIRSPTSIIWRRIRDASFMTYFVHVACTLRRRLERRTPMPFPRPRRSVLRDQTVISHTPILTGTRMLIKTKIAKTWRKRRRNSVTAHRRRKHLSKVCSRHTPRKKSVTVVQQPIALNVRPCCS